MLSEEQFSDWLYRLKIGQEAEKIIRRIRSSPPSRLVGGGGSNVTGRYPIRKMGQTIQFESHKVELAFIREYEFDGNVLEYYDQPGPIKISYQTAGGRTVSPFTTPDFFVIRGDGTASWEECKPEQALVKLAEKSNRFIRDGQGNWRCPPGEEYAVKLGLSFRVRSSAGINWVWQRNMEYLGDYLQADGHITVAPDSAAFLTTLVRCRQGILLSELLANTDHAAPDDVFLMIAQNGLYADVHNCLLCEHDRTPIYTDKELTTADSPPPAPSVRSSAVLVEPGQTVTWDGNPFEIVNASADGVWLKNGGDIVSLELAKLEELVRSGMVKGKENGTRRDEVRALLERKSPKDYAAANERYSQVQPYLSDDSACRPASSTHYKWLKQYRDAELRYGCGYVGLIGNQSEKGNRLPKLPVASFKLLKACVDEKYLSPTRPTTISVYGLYRNRCGEAGVTAASYKTVTTYLKSLDAEETERRRKGPRAAYQLGAFHWELETTTPRHGDRPFEIAHLDHTELDLELVNSATGENCGRPWLTLMVDAFSRAILAFFLSYEHPNYRSCMMVIRECVRRCSRLPQTIVVDGGSDFRSVYFEQLLALNNVVKKSRPGAKPRFGSVLERLFGVANTPFIYSLAGNTQNTRNVRQMTKSVSPARLAVWTFTSLSESLGQYFEEAYGAREHLALGESPRDAFREGMARHGSRPFRLIPYDDAFLLSTLPSTPRGRAKVIQSRGIKINNVYYWHEALRSATGNLVEVRYDPYDIGIAYAFANGSWVRCTSQYYPQFRGRSEYEMKAISAEIVRQRGSFNGRFSASSQQMAAFIAKVQDTEAELKAMKMAAEMRSAAGAPADPEGCDARSVPPSVTGTFEIYDELDG